MFIMKLAIILIAAELGGYISRKFKQPTVLGRLLLGVAIGPSVLGLVEPTDTMLHLSELGVILLMFIAGLETDLKQLIESGKSSSLIALGGVLLPLALGTGVSMLFGLSAAEGMFVGIILCATSVSISVETLREIDKLKTKQGIAILSAAVIDDVVGIVLLSLMTGFVKPGIGQGVVVVILKVLAFFILAIIVGIIVIKLAKWFFRTKVITGQIAIMGLAFCLVMGFISEELGVAAITGAYVAGIILSVTPYRNKITKSVQEVSYILLTPIFFVVTGMKVDISHLMENWVFGLALLVAAVIGKLIGCGIIAKLVGFSKDESLQIGIGMIPRGEVVLIITDMGLRLGVIPESVFAAVIFIVLATTIITPPIMKFSFDKSEKLASKMPA
jgi:Kef-type K+ transport system membrane component KefB